MPAEKFAWINRIGAVPILVSFGPLAFFAPKGMWIPLLLLLLASSKSLASIAPRDRRRVFDRTAVYLILPAYAFLSSAWALVPRDAAATSAKLLGYFLAAAAAVIVVDRLSDADRRSVFIWTAAGLVFADLIVWVDVATAGAISDVFRRGAFTANQYSPGAAISACAILPIAVGLFNLSGSRLALPFAVISVTTVFVLDNEAAKLAAVLGILVYGIVRWRGFLFWPVVLLPLAAGIISPLLFTKALSNSQLCTLYNSKPSAAHRLVIYQFSSQKIFEKPLLGWGMDASRSIPGGDGVVEIQQCSYKGSPPATRRIVGLVPLHPHNGSLQVWLELGAIGVAVFVALLWSLISHWRRGLGTPHGRPLIAGMFTVVFLVYNISFGLWQGWLIFALIFLCAITRAISVAGTATGGDSAR